jgi:HSP20 family protein
MSNFFKKIIGGGEKKKIDESHIKISGGGNMDKMDEEGFEGWLDNDYEEGQLSIDVYEMPDNLIVKSTIAGVKSEDLDISLNNDMLTIRGKRETREEVNDEDYLYRECYWGAFSRSIILPVEIKAGKIDAYLEDGVLVITLPKAKKEKQVSIKVKEK